MAVVYKNAEQLVQVLPTPGLQELGLQELGLPTPGLPAVTR